jgi:hypothetical protein
VNVALQPADQGDLDLLVSQGLRQRVSVEHSLAHIGQWQGERARYLGLRKNLFDLRRVAVVHNLHVLAHQQAKDSSHVA